MYSFILLFYGLIFNFMTHLELETKTREFHVPSFS
jgi:hypothetical protein